LPQGPQRAANCFSRTVHHSRPHLHDLASCPPLLHLEGDLAVALAGLKFADVMNLVDQAVAKDVDALRILNDCRAGMDYVGEKYNSGEYFLSELIMSADIFKKVVEKIEPRLLDGQKTSTLGAMVIATPKGDIHDLGKNLVATFLTSNGFRVVDLGKNVDRPTILQAIKEEKPHINSAEKLEQRKQKNLGGGFRNPCSI